MLSKEADCMLFTCQNIIRRKVWEVRKSPASEFKLFADIIYIDRITLHNLGEEMSRRSNSITCLMTRRGEGESDSHLITKQY